MGFAAVFAIASVIASGPYLTELGAKHVSIRAETDTTEQLTLKITGSHGYHLEQTESAAKGGIHRFELDDLAPKTTYHYSVSGSDHISEDGAFTTAPADDDPSEIHFTLFGDDRGGYGVHENVIRRIQEEAGDFLINTGDLVADGRNGSQWQSFFDIEDHLLRERCLFAAIGNHELIEESGASYLRYFGTTEQQKGHRLYTTFRWGMLRMFFLNGEGTFLGEDRNWLDRELKKADTEPGIIWRIIITHSGPFSSGLHGDNERMHGAEVPALFREHHIDLVLEGHDHIYERGASDGLRYVVSGGAGAPLYPTRHPRTTARKLESSYHYVLFDLDATKGKLTAKRADGSLIESVGFDKTRLWDDDKTAPTPTNPAPPNGSANTSPGPSEPDEGRPTPSSGNVPFYVLAGVCLVGILYYWSRKRRS